MTEQEQKAKFKQAIDHTLSGLDGNPYLFQRVAASAEKGDKHMKYHIPKGVLIALIALLCMGTVAVAAGLYGGTVNWLGEVVPDEQEYAPMPTMAPTMETSADLNEDDLDQLSVEGAKLFVSQVLENGEILPNVSTRMRRRATTMKDLRVLLDGAENMPMPNFIPDGYEYVEGEVYYECRAEGEWKLIDRKTLDGELLAELYSLDKEDELITSYYMLFRNELVSDHYISVYVSLRAAQDVNEHIFGFLGGQTAQAAVVPGMDNALAITSEHSCDLRMRHVLTEPVEYLFLDETGCLELRCFAELAITAYASQLDLDPLIRMFATE